MESSTKKIGITTFWDTPANYGQVLQAFALSQILKKTGFFPFIVRYTMGEEVYTESFWEKIKNLLTDKERFLKFLKRFYLKPETKIDRGFEKFKKDYLAYSEKTYSSFDQIKRDYPDAFLYITGSDQVWGEWGSFNKKKVFLLDFLPDTIKRISYAASFGRSNLSDSLEKDLFKSALSKFTSISVREKSGVNICKSLGLEAKYVLDPTLLLSKEQWIEDLKLKTIPANKKLAFVYLMSDSETTKIGHQVISYLKKSGYQIRYVSSAYYPDKKANFNPTIELWLETISAADLVITSSFHGTIFAANFNTPVISIVKHNGNAGQNTRIYSILEDFNLSHRIIDSFERKKIDSLLNEKINWTEVNQLLERKRRDSLCFLNKALEV